MSQQINKPSGDQQKAKHLKLAGIVKSVHAKLRQKYKQCKYTSVWGYY